MKKIERFLNIIFFVIYKWFILLGETFDTYLLFERKSEVQKLRRKNGFSAKDDIDKRIPINPKFSIDFINAYTFFGGLFVPIGYSLCFLVHAFTKVNLLSNNNGDFIWASHITIFIIAVYIDNFFVFGKDKYVYYFRSFKRLPKQSKKYWDIITFSTIIGLLVLFFCSLYILEIA